MTQRGKGDGGGRLGWDGRERGGEAAAKEKGGGRSPSGAILPTEEGTQSSTVISPHLQPAPSRILIARIPQLLCLPQPPQWTATRFVTCTRTRTVEILSLIKWIRKCAQIYRQQIARCGLFYSIIIL